MIAPRVSSTTLIILNVLLAVLESLAMRQHNRYQVWPAKIAQLDDIPKQKVWVMKTCVFNAILENIPTKMAIKIHRNAKNVVLDSFQMHLVWTNVQIVPRRKPLKVVQRFVPNVTRVNTCLRIKSVHHALWGQ